MTPNQFASQLVEQAAREQSARQRLPESTYRLQFHAGFTFRHAIEIVPYLRELGISHCYASPYLKAQPGSTHGYDIVDHGALNPEIGSAADHDAWLAALEQHRLGLIFDFVPNHMGVGTDLNLWWNDVLENGPASRFASFFDIAWRASNRPDLHDKVLLPVLSEPYGNILETGGLRLACVQGAFSIHYQNRRFPLAPASYALVLEHGLEDWQRAAGPEDPAVIELEGILQAIRNLPDSTSIDPAHLTEVESKRKLIQRKLAALLSGNAAALGHVERIVASFNGRPGDPRSFDLLEQLLERQSYRLAYWRVAPDEINYRRFFDVNDLAALCIERVEVFEPVHALVLSWVAAGKVHGLRIDHPDGLYDPAQYFRRLQEHYRLACARRVFEAGPASQSLRWSEIEGPLTRLLAHGEPGAWESAQGPPLYVLAEKILGARESLVPTWPVAGTTGYEFLNQVNGLFVDEDGAETMSRLYRGLVEDDASFPEVAYRKKRLILQVSLASELQMLTNQLDRLAQQSRGSRDFTFNTLRQVLAEVIACFPVYRSYIDDRGASEADRRYVEAAVHQARARNPLMSRRVFRFVRDLLLGDALSPTPEIDRSRQRRFAGKFQQVTSPVTAKGVEDTAFYVYNRLVSLNEVGGDPSRFGVKPDLLHAFNQQRQTCWPFALSPLSTHDCKRSEDVRARINILGEIPTEWGECVERWSRRNEPHRRNVDDLLAPDANEEYLLYQTLVGAWPLEPDCPTVPETFVKRIQDYMVKAIHEAKVHSSWLNPDSDYDAAVWEFVGLILDDRSSRPFLDDFRVFQRKVSHHGLFNSMAQTLLKLVSPGVPDTYQATELWDFSLVDPDNRRPVDYARRRDLLRELQASIKAAAGDRPELCRNLVASKEDGRVKLFLHYCALHARRDDPGLFSTGEYHALEVAGAKSPCVFAFTRGTGDHQALVATPRLWARLLTDPSSHQPPQDLWQDTRLVLDARTPSSQWRNVFTAERLMASYHEGQRSLACAELFTHFPVALLLSEPSTHEAVPFEN